MLLLADLQLQGLTAERQCDFAARYSRSLWTEWARPRAGARAWRDLSPADARWDPAEGEREPSPLLGGATATQSPAIARAFFDQLDERARDRSVRSRKLVEDRIVVACGQNGKGNR